MTRVEFVEAMAVLQAGIGREFQKQQNEAFWECLKDLTPDSLRYAVKRWLCEVCSGFPNIAELRTFAAEFNHGADDLSGSAWDKAMKAVRWFGTYRKEEAREKLDPRTWQAIEHCGGWQWICETTIDNRAIFSAQFKKAWQALADQNSLQERLPEDVRPKIGKRNPALELAERMKITE